MIKSDSKFKNHVDYYTSTKEFEQKYKGDHGTYHWKKFKKYFSKGDQILIRISSEKRDVLIRLTADPVPIPASKKDDPWYHQKYQADFKVIKVDDASFGKSRNISKPEKEGLLKKNKNKCSGISYRSEFCKNPINIKCTILFDDDIKPEFDHIREYSRQGGLSISENIAPLCPGCHKVKTDLVRREMENILNKYFKRPKPKVPIPQT